MEITFVELKQRHIEAFLLEMPRGDDALNMPLPVYFGNAVRAAIKAGWITEKLEDVGEMAPAEVKALAEKVQERFNSAMGISPS